MKNIVDKINGILDPRGQAILNRTNALVEMFPEFKDVLMEEAHGETVVKMPPDEIILKMVDRVREWQAENGGRDVPSGPKAAAKNALIELSVRRLPSQGEGSGSINLLAGWVSDPNQILDEVPRNNGNHPDETISKNPLKRMATANGEKPVKISGLFGVTMVIPRKGRW